MSSVAARRSFLPLTSIDEVRPPICTASVPRSYHRPPRPRLQIAVSGPLWGLSGAQGAIWYHAPTSASVGANNLVEKIPQGYGDGPGLWAGRPGPRGAGRGTTRPMGAAPLLPLAEGTGTHGPLRHGPGAWIISHRPKATSSLPSHGGQGPGPSQSRIQAPRPKTCDRYRSRTHRIAARPTSPSLLEWVPLEQRP